MRAFLGFLVAMSFSSPALADSYICVPEQSVGYEYADAQKAWEPKQFSVSKKRLVVRPIKETDTFSRDHLGELGLFDLETGSDFVLSNCKLFPLGGIYCSGGVMLRMDVNTLQFAAMEVGGYLMDPEVDALRRNNVAVEIGTCSRM